MFVPFVFSLDTLNESGNYFHWRQFYKYADGCIKNKWPIISHERYFSRFSHVEEKVFGIPLKVIISTYCMKGIPTSEEMLALKAYPVSQSKEDALIAKYASQFDCWVDLLSNENAEFEQIIGELLDRIADDFVEKPEGILVYEYLPKALLSAANKRGIPVIFQGGGVLRPPFTSKLNAFSLINTNSAEAVKAKYDRFKSENPSVPMLTQKGLLRLHVSEQYISDVHNIDNEPEYDVGVLYQNLQLSIFHAGQKYVSDQELSARAKAKYNKVLIRTRPGFEQTGEALDDSPTCFHFCCKCKRVLGFSTKGMFEAMLASRIPHEYGSFIFHSFSNNGIEDDSLGLAPIEFLNFVLFTLSTPIAWLTEPDYLRFLLLNPSEKEQYMRSFHYYTQDISKEDLELYYMTSGRMYRLSDPLYFTSGHKPHEYAAYYCRGGLCIGNGICTWSNGECTSFEFDLTETVKEPLTISVVLYDVAMDWSSPNPAQTVKCEVNGMDCGSITLVPCKKYLRFNIPTECFTDKLQITFRYSYLHSSGDLKIAIAFEQMYISSAGQRFIENAMTNEIAVMASKISELEANNAGLNAQISGLVAQNFEQSAQICELEANNAGLNAQISGLVAQNFEQSAQISGLKAENTEQKEQISKLEAQNSEQSAQISGLKAENTKQKEQISKLEAQNTEQKEQISGLEVQNTEQKEQISGLEAQNSERSSQISGLESQIQLIYSSRSWKLGNGIIKTAAKIILRKK